MDVIGIMDVKSHLDKMDQIARTQVRDEEVREFLLGVIEEDRISNHFSLEKYLEFYGELGRLGQVQMEIWKTEKVLKRFYGSLAVVRAAVRFKRGIKKLI